LKTYSRCSSGVFATASAPLVENGLESTTDDAIDSAMMRPTAPIAPVSRNVIREDPGAAGSPEGMSRRSSDTARRAGLLAVAVALGAAIAAAGARLAGRGPTFERLRPGGTGRSEPETYTCRCGRTYRVSGTDRHRVYWPAEAPENAPVLGDRCVDCDAPLPSGHVPVG
jgi:hypothetical protein